MKAIIFDANFLFYCSPNLKSDDVVMLKKNDIEPIVSDLVIQEFKDKNFREVLCKYKALVNVLNDHKTDLYYKQRNLMLEI